MANLTIAEVLERAADLIEPEGRWTQGYYARSARGRRVTTREAAACFCAIGAIDFVQGAKPGEEVFLEPVHLLATCATGRRGGSVPIWNDAPDRTQAEVVAKLREAAALAREQGK